MKPTSKTKPCRQPTGATPDTGNGKLHYTGRYFVAKLGPVKLPIPEWLLLGHTTITETALDDDRFAMDFRLIHPLFGQIYRYAGTFRA